MIYINAKAFIDGGFADDCSITTEDGVIVKIEQGFIDNGCECVDCEGGMLIPGLVDIHTHGCAGFDFSSASQRQIEKMRSYYLENGITSILATTVTMSDLDIKLACENISRAKKAPFGARILGINLEGPYLSPKKCGAHDISLLKKPDPKFISSLGDDIKIVNAAAEYDNIFELIDSFSGKVSIAHTDCDYERALEAIKAGANHITHIFNAMNPLHHRKPGVIGAFFDSDAFAEIICDGVHISPTVLRMMFKLAGKRLCVISDSMAATGLSDGEYLLGKLPVTVKNSTATLEDGTLAGSTTNVFTMLRRLISFGIDPRSAIRAVTEIPAASIGVHDKVGVIKVGAYADMLLLNDDYTLREVFFNGEPREKGKLRLT